MTEVTYAYIPNSYDNVYEDMCHAVFLVKGLSTNVAPAHALIRSAISKDEEANEKQVLKSLLALVDESFLDEEPNVKDNALYKALKAMPSLQWSSLETKDELEDMDLSGKMDIPFVYYHTGGLAFAMQ
jgi:hypothetical protein